MFFKDQANTEIYTLSLHDALPISGLESANILEKLSMKLGADNPKKVIITAALTVFALALFIYMVFSGSGLGTASATPTQPEMGRAHVSTPVNLEYPIPPSAFKKTN